VTIADDAIELAGLAGLTLTAADRGLLADGMAQGADGRWLRSEVTAWGPAVLARELAGLFLLGELVLAACSDARVRKAVSCEVADAISAEGSLARRLKRVCAANGDERIELSTGGRMQFALTGSRCWGRGYAAGLIVAYAGPAGISRRAVLPVAASRPGSQIWYAVR
jgi:hypothetical protein